MISISSLVIEDMIARFEAGQSARPVYFYCTRSAAEPERSNPHAVLASILRQLSCVQPDAPILSLVIEKYKRQGEGFTSNGLDLDESLDLIIRLLEDYSMTTIIVDALDECDPQMRQSLLDAFEHILKESVGLVKIFVSSRNDQDIVCTLRDYPNMDISSDKNTGDIKAYVKAETMKFVKSGQLLRNSRAKGEMTASIIEQVCGGADGMFRWASLQLDVLRALKRDEDIRARLGRLPPKLEQLYLEVYNNLISDQGAVSRAIIDNALKWLLCAKEEFPASEFLVAVAANLEASEGDISVNDLLDLCNNFVIYDDYLDVFRFAHLSVREFLEQRPEFAKISCYSLAAECCLLQIIASSKCPASKNLMSDEHLLRLRGTPNSTEWSSSEDFLEYANRFWIDYCQSIPLSNSSDDSKFGRIFRFFFSDKLESALPLNAWVQWYCSRVLSEWHDSAAALKLQALLITSSDSLSRSLFVATYFDFSDILASCIKHRGLGDDTKDQGLLLAAMAAQHETFDIISQNREDWALTEPLLFHAVRASDKERLGWLLDKAPDTMITHRVFTAVAEDRNDENMAILLDRYPDLTITERTLQVAVETISLENFRLLVARAAKPVITSNMLLTSLHTRSSSSKPVAAFVEKIELLLDKTGEFSLTPTVMGLAAYLSYEHVIEVMLEKGGAGNITEEVMVRAVGGGRQSFQCMLHHGGKVTDTVLDEAASTGDVGVWQVLLEQGYGSSINSKRLKLAATKNVRENVHGGAVLSVLLEHVDDTTLANEIAGLIHEVARNGRNGPIKQLLDHAEDVEISQDMLLAAVLNRSGDLLGRVQLFLERSSGAQITEEMLVIAASDGDHGFELIQMLLEREGEIEISKYVLMAAAWNQRQEDKIIQLLLEQNSATELTKDVLICAAQYSSPDIVLELLERCEAKVPTGRLLQAAAANWRYDGKIVKLLLARAKITELPEAVFIEAVATGTDVLLVLEEIFGRINVTESLMAKCIQKATLDTVEFLLSRFGPAQITEEIFICALRNSSDDSEGVQCCVAENSMHIPITTEILVSAAQYVEPDLFRFLWNRGRQSSVPENLINAAVGDSKTFEFLLREANYFEIGIATLTAIVANRYTCDDIFDLLLEQGLQADTTEGVPETLLKNGGIKVKCSSPTQLQLSKRTKVTEDMFRIAANCGNKNILEKLAKFCKLDRTPEKWLDIARLYNAAKSEDVELLQTLLRRRVDSDVAGPDGVTPLVAAVEAVAAVPSRHEEVVQMLLSAGALPDGGPNLKFPPLCHAVDWGHYEIVKILVSAGASLDFKDDEGQTPEMLAKSQGHILIFRYLEQSRIEQEGRREGTPSSE